MTGTAYLGARIFDGTELHDDRALLVAAGRCQGLSEQVPAGYDICRLDGGVIAPGFVDLQVNGGGGVMFNDDTSVAGLRRIAEAHGQSGTRALLPTLITDTPARTAAAIEAVAAAIAQGVPGILGLHLEGPHLAPARKGAHDAALIRAMTDADEALLHEAATRLPNLLVTVAPESVSPAQIARLSAAGIIVSLGHSDCDYDTARACFAAGARCVTHLFNAMSPLTSRAPGLVGAALDCGVSAGVIADGIHVHPVTLRAACAAKRGAGGLFLVTDAMATVGSEITEFTLNERRILRRDGRLTLADGTLAGADLTLPRALQVMTEAVGLDLAAALAMATAAPAALLRDPQGHGSLRSGAPVFAIHLGADWRVTPLSPR